MYSIRRNLYFFTFLFIFYPISILCQASEVGKWKRIEISINNSTYSGNPFELEIEATFTHSTTQTELTLPGYYAGNNIWKIGFMPTEIGQWSYITSSADPQLNGVTGIINCIPSNLAGMLKRDVNNPKKWKYTEGTYAIPIALRLEFFCEPATLNRFEEVADFLEENNIQMLETRLTEELGQFENGRHDFIFEGNWQDHQFDLSVWNRMDDRMEELIERGLGAHIMFYSDDDGAPGWNGQSETEALVIRYTIARLAGYPVVLFNTGIDISEYRSEADIDWFGEQISALDPYEHPLSSRRDGGGSSHIMSSQSFNSRTANYIQDMLNHYNEIDSLQASMDDAWGENYISNPSKNFTPSDIRRQFWKCLIAGGVGGLIRGSEGYFYLSNVENDLESEQWLKLVNPFIENILGDTFSEMEPTPSLVSNVGHYCLADADRNKILYFLMGENDKWDTIGGGPVTVKLSGLSGSYNANWFNTRNGVETSIGLLAGGSNHTLTPPSPNSDDWVLFLSSEVLPVELISFTASVTDRIVNLYWATATEINNLGFEIERQIRNRELGLGSWVKIGFVEGNGNSSSTRNYSFTDKNPIGGTRFIYRLKQIDNDGTFSYSPQAEVDLIPSKFELYQNYPNPFNPITKISFSIPKEEELTLKVYDVLGNEVKLLLEGYFETGYYEVQFDGSDLSSGLYFYELKTSGYTSIKKMVLIK